MYVNQEYILSIRDVKGMRRGKKGVRSKLEGKKKERDLEPLSQPQIYLGARQKRRSQALNHIIINNS